MRTPFRLALTVAALQRRPENPVDTWSADRRYLRAFDTARGPVAWAVTEEAGGTRLRVELFGDVHDPRRWRGLVTRLLGTDIDLVPFYARAESGPSRLASRMARPTSQ
ncbi:hypothetical protein [Sorangium sp. So ce124]|uniref:hypothetical protein n=1 Tax=Sorangium sp. So ce124 TaxID=3133280 RepID=UPI003F6443A9